MLIKFKLLVFSIAQTSEYKTNFNPDKLIIWLILSNGYVESIGTYVQFCILNKVSPNNYTMTLSGLTASIHLLQLTINDSYSLTMGSVYATTISTLQNIIIDAVSHNADKIQVFYETSNKKLASYSLQRHNMSFVTDLLVDTNIPLTKKMVALSTDGIINGIATSNGIGDLYGGDTITVAVPDFT